MKPSVAPMTDVTQILSQVSSGDAKATEQLLPLVYDELRRLARAQMCDERSEHTLQPTALVHEVYLRLIGDSAPHLVGRGHFFATAAEAMQRGSTSTAGECRAANYCFRHFWATPCSAFRREASDENAAIFLRADDLTVCHRRAGRVTRRR